MKTRKQLSAPESINTPNNGLLVAVTTMAAACALPSHTQAAAPEPPTNILLIIADDLNDWIGPMGGHSQVRTPALDKLAAQGVTFTNAQCPAPLCNPSRTAFMSGLRPSTTGIYVNGPSWTKHIAPGQCINDYIRKHGFKSYAAGKVYHYEVYRPEEWDDVFYESDDTLPGGAGGLAGRDAKRRPSPFGYRMFTEDEPREPFNEKRAESALVDVRSVDWCIEKLDKNTNQRFFMACGIHRPHTPWDVPKKYFDLYPEDDIQLPKVLKNDLDDVPPAGLDLIKRGRRIHKQMLTRGIWKDRVRSYLAAISFMDAQVGRLLEALAKSPHASNTVVVFVGDNGWHLGQKEHWGKSTLWGAAAQVPMIWAGPGVAKGAKSDAGVDLMSLYPTLCDMVKIPTPNQLDGVSIKPLLANPSMKWEQPALTTSGKDNHALVTADWRYIRYSDGSEELYNRKTDPLEWTNMADKSKMKQVKRELSAWLPKKNAEPIPYKPNMK